jgi:hypothetical protein
MSTYTTKHLTKSQTTPTTVIAGQSTSRRKAARVVYVGLDLDKELWAKFKKVVAKKEGFRKNKETIEKLLRQYIARNSK